MRFTEVFENENLLFKKIQFTKGNMRFTEDIDKIYNPGSVCVCVWERGGGVPQKVNPVSFY